MENLRKDATDEDVLVDDLNIDQELLDSTIYILSGYDMADVLLEMGKRELLDDKEEFKKLLKRTREKLEIPWREYLEEYVHVYDENRKKQ